MNIAASQEPLVALGRLIAAALSPDRSPSLPDTAAWSDQAWLRIIELSNAHRLVPALGGAIKILGASCPVPADVGAYFELIYGQNVKRNALLRDQTAALVFALNNVGVQPLLLKGAAELMRSVYPDTAMRLVGDIDLLVLESQLIIAKDALLSLGYQPKKGEMVIAPGQHHFPTAYHPQHVAPIELHRTLGAEHFANSFDNTALFERAERISAAGISFLMLEPTDAFIYSVFHNQLHHRASADRALQVSRFLDLVVMQLCCGDQIDVARVRRWFDAEGHRFELDVELALVAGVFGVSSLRFAPLTPAAVRLAEDMLSVSQSPFARRVERTLSLLRRGFSRARFERERGGGTWLQFMSWRIVRLCALFRKYRSPKKIWRLSQLIRHPESSDGEK